MREVFNVGGGKVLAGPMPWREVTLVTGAVASDVDSDLHKQLGRTRATCEGAPVPHPAENAHLKQACSTSAGASTWATARAAICGSVALRPMYCGCPWAS